MLATNAAPQPQALGGVVRDAIASAGGWLGFERFMELALYQPGQGYYANNSAKFGRMPSSGSDFCTAPELSPYFGRALAAQLREALQLTQTDEIWEFGAGSGALAAQLLDVLGEQVRSYTVVDLSGSLRGRQQETLARFGARVRWVSELPGQFQGVVLGNELLDAMPVALLARVNGVWHERGVVALGSGFAFADKPTERRPPLLFEGSHDYVTEIHPQAEAFVRTVADRLARGAAFLIDYGFPEAEYYHPQRHMGTLVCHRAHLVDADPLADVGQKDITAHVNFTGIALAAQSAGLGVLGYCSQARFLMNCGLLDMLADATLAQRSDAQKLLTEHEMGELFKVIGLYRGEPWAALGFAAGDRTHTL